MQSLRIELTAKLQSGWKDTTGDSNGCLQIQNYDREQVNPKEF